jgi:Ni/Co efflux regulator RcnB
MRKLLVVIAASVCMGGAAMATPVGSFGAATSASLQPNAQKLIRVAAQDRDGGEQFGDDDRDRDHDHHHRRHCDRDDRVSPSRPCWEHSIFWRGGDFDESFFRLLRVIHRIDDHEH